MQRAADISRFLINLSFDRGLADPNIKASRLGLLHRILLSPLAQSTNSRRAFVDLANHLIRAAEYAFSVRDMGVVQEAGEILMGLPIEAARQIGLYYHALAINRKGQRNEAERLLEEVAESAPLVYRARAIQTLGAFCINKGQPDEALRFQIEALRAASDKNGRNLLATLMAQLEISHIQADADDHQGALKTLENLSPLMRVIAKQYPFYFYVYHNELAVELNEVNRIAEAEAACAVALASPFAPAYPEWRETRDEIAAKRRSASHSIIAINRATEANASSQIEPERKKEIVSAFVFNRPSRKKDYFQTSIVTIAATATITHNGMNQSILDWMRRCTGPRAPPARP